MEIGILDRGEWVASIAILLFFFLIGALWNRYILGRLEHLVKKTETKIDDYVLEAMRTPMRYALFIIGMHYALLWSPIKDASVTVTLVTMTKSGIAFCFLWTAFRLFDYNGSDGFIHNILSNRKIDHADAIANIVSAIIRVIVCVLGFGLICGVLGFDLSAFIASLSIGTAAIAFAAKDMFTNVFGSFVILVDEPFKEGDWIKTKELEGIVKKITLRTTCILTVSGEMVHIPSAILANDAIINRSQSHKRRIELSYQLAIDTVYSDVEEVLQEIKEYLMHQDGVLHNNGVRVYVKAVTSISYNVALVCDSKYTDYVMLQEYTDLKGRINLDVVSILEKHNIKMALQNRLGNSINK